MLEVGPRGPCENEEKYVEKKRLEVGPRGPGDIEENDKGESCWPGVPQKCACCCPKRCYNKNT